MVALDRSDHHDFDPAIVDFGFHNFEDPRLAAKRLGERLKPAKGVLVTVDFPPHDHSPGGGKLHHDYDLGYAHLSGEAHGEEH